MKSFKPLKLMTATALCMFFLFSSSDRADSATVTFDYPDNTPGSTLVQNVSLSEEFGLASYDSFLIGVRHFGNKDNGSERWSLAWSMDGGTPSVIGNLGDSNNNWLYQEFTIDQGNTDFFDSLENEYELNFLLVQGNNPTNEININYIAITASGTPVPISGTAWLLASGLLGLGWLKRRSAS